MVKSASRILVLLAVVLATWLPTGSPAHAYIPRCGTLGNYFNGFVGDTNIQPVRVEGASAYLRVRPSAVCDTEQRRDFNFSVAWVMTTGSSYAARSGYSQVGTFKYYNSCTYHWAEWNVDGAGIHIVRRVAMEFGCLASGEVHAESVRWNSGCYCLQNVVDVTVLNQTDFNPFVRTDAWPPPLDVQYNAETVFQESDIPGTASAPNDFSSLGIQRFDNGQFELTRCYLLPTVPQKTRAGRAADSCNHFTSWTQ